MAPAAPISTGTGTIRLVRWLGQHTVYGGNGNDVLIGGVGDDFLVGGVDADTYVFGQNSGFDVVIGFDAESGDHLDLMGQNYVTVDDGFGSLLLQLSGGGEILLQGTNSPVMQTSSFV
jgi:Ca2+-binding RTX toxin-like protein